MSRALLNEILCAAVLCAVVEAQETAPAATRHDALAHARAKAKSEHQRVLLLLTGGDAAVDAALRSELENYRSLGKLLKYEYQLAAVPGASLPGKAAEKRLGLSRLHLPALVAVTVEDEVLGTLNARLKASGGSYFADGRLTVADLKVFVWVRSLKSGLLDHVPTDLVDEVAPLLVEHMARIAAEPGVVGYYETRGG